MPYFGRYQSHSRSSMLIPLKTSSRVLVMINSMSMLICNSFHIKRTNTGKIKIFRCGTLFYALVRGERFNPAT